MKTIKKVDKKTGKEIKIEYMVSPSYKKQGASNKSGINLLGIIMYVLAGLILILLFTTIKVIIGVGQTTHYLEGMYKMTDTEGMCLEMNKTFKNERCYLTIVEDLDENDTIVDVDCSWGNYSLELNTDVKISQDELNKGDWNNRFTYYTKLKPLMYLLHCEI